MEAGSRTYHARSRLSPAGRPGMMHKTFGWLRANMPTRESMESNRLLRPVAHRVMEPGLWRFNRRSVPRGVALGMVTGRRPIRDMVFLPYQTYARTSPPTR